KARRKFNVRWTPEKRLFRGPTSKLFPPQGACHRIQCVRRCQRRTRLFEVEPQICGLLSQLIPRVPVFMRETENQPFQLSFNASLRVDFQRSRVTSGGGLILIRELDEQLGFGEL